MGDHNPYSEMARRYNRAILDAMAEADEKRWSRRSFWDRNPRLKRWPTTGWEGDDLGPADGVGLVIVEIDEVDSIKEGGPVRVVDEHAIGPAVALVIDWRQAQIDPEYAANLMGLVNRQYARMGYIEAERFVTILDRLDDIMWGHGDPEADLSRGPMDTI